MLRDPRSVEERLADVERFVQRQGEAQAAYTLDHNRLDARLLDLEEKEKARAITAAREEERDKALQERLARIERAIEGIQGVGNKLVWIAMTAVVGAFLAFIIKGGLAP